MPPLQAPAQQMQPIMIDQKGQTMSPGQINAFYQQPAQQIPQQGIGDRIAGALLGQQSQAQEPQTQIDASNGMIASGAGVNPRTGGLLPDLISGFQENAQTPFNMQNLDPVKDKGFATQVGEGLGTAGRFLASPTGRGLLMAGLVGATGGGPINALNIGLQAGVGNQMNRTQNQFYRQQLQNEGVDTSNIQGYVTPEMYKNQSLGAYRTGSLAIREQLGLLGDNTKRAGLISTALNNGTITPQEARERMQEYGITLDDMKRSNQSRNADINAYLAPARKSYYEQMPALAGGRLGLQQAQFEMEAPLKQLQLQKGLMELQSGGIPVAEMTKMRKGVGAVESQIDRFTGTFKGLPEKAESYTGGQIRRLTGTQTTNEANFNSQRTLLFNKIARELGGEKGVLSDQDIQRIDASLPNLTDSYAQKQAKMQAVYDLLGDVKNRYGMTGGQQLQPFTPNANLTPIPRTAIGGNRPQPKRQTQSYTQVGKYKVRVK